MKHLSLMEPGTPFTRLAQRCRRLLNKLEHQHLREPDLLLRVQLAIQRNNIDAARQQLARVTWAAANKESSEVYSLLLELHSALNTFKERLVTLVPAAARADRFDAFKAWIATPTIGEDGQHD